MEKGSTIILKCVICLFGILVLALCIFVLPWGISSDETGYYRPLLLSMYIPAIPFFVALFQSLKLLGYIEKNKIFSDVSVKALKYIKYSAIAISLLYVAGMPYILYVADKDDAPGAAVIGFVIIFASFVIATAAAVFEKLLQTAVEMKSENDLTV